MRLIHLAVAGVLAAGASGSLRADEPNWVYGYAQVMNNYVSRGLSQSVGAASAQVELDVNPGAGLYANLSAVHIGWVDELWPGDSVHVEVDGVLGWRGLWARDGEWKAGVLRLQFPGRYAPQSPPVTRPDTTEVFGYVRWRGLSARLNVAVTDAFATPDSRGAWYLDLNATRPLDEVWSLGAHLGRRQSRGTNPDTGADNARLFSYTDYKLSVTRSLGARRSLTLAYTWTTANPAIYTLDGYRVGGPHLSAVLEQDF